MGLLMSSMPQGTNNLELFISTAGSAKMFSFAMEAVYRQLTEEEKTDFEPFYAAMLDVFSTFNDAMPGRHYVVPRLTKVKICILKDFFQKWKEDKPDEEKRKMLLKFMRENVEPRPADPAILFTGLLTPPAALAAKKAGERLPQLKMIKQVPDVLFVPTATVVALISVKISRRFFRTKLATE